MNIYEIDRTILLLVDPDTGEIADFEALEALTLEREQKVENIALWIKNLTAESKAIREEEKALAERRKAAENKAARLTDYLGQILAGDKFQTARVSVSWRKSKSLEIDETVFLASPDAAEFVRFEPKYSKTDVTNAIKAGAEIPGAVLVEKNNIQIK